MKEIGPTLIKQYFAGECTKTEQGLVEKWLNENAYNLDQVLQFIEECPQTDKVIVSEVLNAKNDVWEKISDEINNVPNKDIAVLAGNFNKYQLRSGRAKRDKSNLKVIVALCGLLFIVFAGLIVFIDRPVIIKTAYGQVQNVTLPDGSVVYLNSNSQLRYKNSWRGKNREVWLEGEAFFKITHLKNHRKFVVHLADQMDVEVLGTEFNVLSRKRERTVVLKSGKIKLSVQEDKSKRNIYLKPGDLVTTDIQKKEKIKKTVVNPELYYAWIDHKWALDNTSLEEILLKLKNTYGVTAIVQNKELMQKRASGSIPLSEANAHTLINDISNIFELTVKIKEDTIYLQEAR